MALVRDEDRPFLRRSALVLSMALAMLAGALLVWHALGFLLLVFAGVLLAVFLNGLAGWVADHTPLGYRVSLGLVGATLVGLLALGAMSLGPDLGTQFGRLVEEVPSSLRDLRDTLSRQEWGRAVLERLPGSASEMRSGSSDLMGRVTGIFSRTFGLLTNVAVVLFLGVYMALDPGLYRRGAVKLMPPARRDAARSLLDDLAGALRSWLAGRLASMAVVAALTAVGLLIAGVPLVLGLSVLAGLLSFVPLIGPAVSAVPAILVGWSSGGVGTALWVAAVFGVVQFVESYLVTPLIQKRVVSMPPALLLTAQILLGLAAGVLGVFMATPVAVVVVVLVQVLWVGRALGDDVEPLGA